MEEKDFYPFKKSSEFERKFEFEESDWDDISSKLDDIDNQKRRPVLTWWWVAAAAAFIPLLFGNILFFQKWQDSQSITQNMKSDIDRLSIQIKPKTDTIIQTEYVYVFDTIENTRIVYQDKPVQSNYTRFHLPSHLGISAQTNPLLLTEFSGVDFSTSSGILLAKENLKLNLVQQIEALAEAQQNRVNNSGEDILEKNKSDETTGRMAFKEPLSALPMLDYNLLESAKYRQNDWEDMWDLNIQTDQRKKPLAQLQAAFQPSGFAVGLSGASLMPIAKHLDEKTGYSVGLLAELAFAGNIHLWAAATNTHLQYQSDVMGAALGIPVVAAPGDDYIFQDATVNRKLNTYSLGLKHIWNKNGKWQPYASVGYGITQVLPYHIIYDFNNVVSEDVDISLEKDIEDEMILKNMLDVGVGMEYVMKDNWRLGLSGFYRTQMNKTNTSIPDYVSVKASIAYQF